MTAAVLDAAGRQIPASVVAAKTIPEIYDERTIERFWSKVIADPKTGCLLWTGTVNGPGGYGVVSIGGRVYSTHRVAYTVANGEIPPLAVIDHICFNRQCVNPEHLRVAGHYQNLYRRDPAKTPLYPTHCIHGHEFTPENTYVVPATGARQCKECNKDAVRRYHERLNAGRSKVSAA